MFNLWHIQKDFGILLSSFDQGGFDKLFSSQFHIFVESVGIKSFEFIFR